MKIKWFICVAALTAGGLASAQNIDQLLQEKQGRTHASPIEVSGFAVSTQNFMEQHLRSKLGRYSPMEEAAQDAAQSNMAFRNGSSTETPLSAIDQHFLAKLGRLPRR